MEKPNNFIIIGVGPIVLKNRFKGFKYKCLFQTGNIKWIDNVNTDNQQVIPEVHKAIQVNLKSYEGITE